MKLIKSKFTPLKLLELAGFDQQKLLALSQTNNKPMWDEEAIRKNTLVNVIVPAARLTKDPTFALHLGQRSQPSHFGIFGFAMQSCSNLIQVLHLLLRYHPLIVSEEIRWEICELEGKVAVRCTLNVGSPEQKRLMAELAFSNFFATTKYLIGKPLTASELQLNYSKPDYYRSYRKYFPVTLKFDQPYNQILVSNETLNLPVRTANPAGHVIFQQQCEEMLRELNRIENTSAAVRRLLIQSAGNFLNIDEVAEKLHVSKSTLGRRLESESNSFRTIIDEVKNLLAQKYLTSTDLTVADVAHLVDYTDTASFRRAFLRWNKMTPAKFRETN